MKEPFRRHGISYEVCKQPKSDLFRDMLPLLNSGHIILPRHERLIAQIVGLERKVSRAGRQHRPCARRHDDLANAVGGVVGAIGSGGVFPVSLGLTSDLVGTEKRQVAIGRTLAGSMTGNLLGASASGLIGDFLGWRGVLAVLGLLVIAASLAVAAGFRGADLKRPPRTSLKALRHGYRTIFNNPNARVCYAAVFVEGCCVLGLFPFIAAFLFDLGETSLSIAGIVIAGFAVGGLFYTLTVSRFLPRLGVRGMMIAGGTLVGLLLIVTAFGPGWKIQALSLLFMGWGFYMIHGCLQVFASELSVEARATALSLHSFFFFMGQTVGPIAYGFGIQHAGKVPTLLAAACVMIALGLVCATLLRERRPADAAPL